MPSYTQSGYQSALRPPQGAHGAVAYSEVYDPTLIWSNGEAVVTGGWRAVMPADFSAVAPSATDAFSRLRTSNPVTAFDSTFQYGLALLIYETGVVGTASIVHSPLNACAILSASGAGTGNAVIQSYRYVRYQPGKSMLVLSTFAMGAPVVGTTKRIGLWDTANGFYLEQSGTAVNLTRRSASSVGDQVVPQSEWNIDSLNGNGLSRITLDLTKTQILVMDAQWLGVGRVRMGFDINGTVYYAHQFLHANAVSDVYTQTLNLPVRAQLMAASGVVASMKMMCASVQSEGGTESEVGYNFATQGGGTAGNDARAHILSIQPTTGFNGQTNRAMIALEDVSVCNTSTNTPLYWELCLGTTVGGPFAAVNPYSTMEANMGGTLTGAPTIVIANGYVTAAVQSKGVYSKSVSTKYPITLDMAGQQRVMGRLSVLASGMGGSAACNVALGWKEIY